MFRSPRGFYRPTYRRGPRTLVGCGCGSLGLSLLLSAIATLAANLLARRRY